MDVRRRMVLERSWFLTGPTAVGKSAASLLLARALDAEIISLDSMAVYRGMDIGTAKPDVAMRALVPHHLLDICDPHEDYSIARYREAALRLVEEITARGRTPLFVGGTPLYLKGLVRGMFDGPPGDDTIRAELEARAATIGVTALHAELGAVDASAAQRIQPNDLRRIVRALEVLQLTGRTISEQQREFADPVPAAACRVFVLHRPRPELHARINQRVLQMFDEGLIAETTKILQSPHGFGRTAAQAVGYHEVLEHLAGRCSLPRAIELIQARTRQFAKRQLTWFRGLSECRMVECDDYPDTNNLVQAILSVGNQRQPL